MRRATIRTAHDDPGAVARAIVPDNTDEMSTQADGSAVVTRIERETTGGLHSTVDDYVVNVDVATRVVQHANRPADASASATRPADANGSADRPTDANASDTIHDTNDE